jgi:hypothetical protein
VEVTNMKTNSMTKKRTIARKAETGAITVTEAKKLVAQYARMRDITPREAELALIASGFRRLSALWRFAEKGGKS